MHLQYNFNPYVGWGVSKCGEIPLKMQEYFQYYTDNTICQTQKANQASGLAFLEMSLS